MRQFSAMLKANSIVFVSSFCVMVTELVAARIMAPYIGVSLYTWTSIIGVILGGIALGNYLGGKIADRYPSSLVLAIVFLAGSLLTFAIPFITSLVADSVWFWGMPLMLGFVLRIACIFLLPAVILSMVSPLVIKLTLADLGKTGGVVGTIYAFSTVGSIFGTFMTGFYFILWFGIRTLILYVGGVLFVTGLVAMFAWNVPDRWRLSTRNAAVLLAVLVGLAGLFTAFQLRALWEEDYTAESIYHNIQVTPDTFNQEARILRLDRTTHSYVIPDDPLFLRYDYIKIFSELISYTCRDNAAPGFLHLGGGGYSLPRYLDAVYPHSKNDVVEIDPAVTQVAHQELGLPPDTDIRTFNQDARLYLVQRDAGQKYDVVVGDVFSDYSTPYHLTTLEFARLVKQHMKPDGIYLVNIIDSFRDGQYMPAFINTLGSVFEHIHVFSRSANWEDGMLSNYVIAAADNPIDFSGFLDFTRENRQDVTADNIYEGERLQDYLLRKNAILLTDDYAPTDILLAPLIR